MVNKKSQILSDNLTLAVKVVAMYPFYVICLLILLK